jgi:heterodisulfide reductase subunit A
MKNNNGHNNLVGAVMVVGGGIAGIQASLDLADLGTNAQLMSVDGNAGNFIAGLRCMPRYVDEKLCTACGTCTGYCPVTIKDQFNDGLSLTKALHIDYQQAIPAAYYVDEDVCLFLTKRECKQCEMVCLAKAIDFKQKPQDIDLYYIDMVMEYILM